MDPVLDELRVFSGNAHPQLARNVCDYLKIPLGQAEMFKLSNDGKRIVSFSEKRLISRIKGMFGRRKLRARITPIGEKPIVVTFDISGLETAIQPLRKACYW